MKALLTRAVLLFVLIVAAVGAGKAGAGTARARMAVRQQCPEPYPATRDRLNPLNLPDAPGANPLTGARFFVPGPAKGSAARAIAQLVGLDPDRLPVDQSWSSFVDQLGSGGSTASWRPTRLSPATWQR